MLCLQRSAVTKDFPLVQFFLWKEDHTCILLNILFTKNKDFPYAYILYRLSKVHFMYFYSIGNLQPHEDFSTRSQKPLETFALKFSLM